MSKDLRRSGPYRGGRDSGGYGDRDRDRDFDRDRDRDRDRRPERPRPYPPRRASEHSERDLFPDKPSTGKSTQGPPSSVRSDAYSDTAATSRNSPLAISQPNATSLPSSAREPEIIRLIDLVCHRVFWFDAWDKLDKKQKKLQADLDRCKSTRAEFPSAFDLLSAQQRGVEDAKVRNSKRLRDTDHKLQGAILSILDTYRPSPNRDLSKPTPGAGSVGISTADLESRLAAMQRSTQEAFTKQLQEETRKLKDDIKRQCEVDTIVLKKRLESESKRNDALQERIDGLVCRLDGLDKTGGQKDSDNNAAALASIGETVTTHTQQLTDLTARLHGVSETMATKTAVETAITECTQGETDRANSRELLASAARQESDVKLSSIESTLTVEMAKARAWSDDVKQCLADTSGLNHRLADFESLLNRQAELQKSTHAAVVTLRATASSKEPDKGVSQAMAKVADVTSEGNTTPSDERINQTMAPQLASLETRLRASFMEIAAAFGKIIDGEGKAREAMKGRVDEAVELVSSTVKDLNDLKAKLDKTLEDHTQQLSNNKEWQKGAFGAVYTNLNEATREIRAHLEELAMQLQCMNTWQNNFTTRELYKQITDHIVATLPSGVSKQIRALSMRLDMAEKRFQMESEGAATKKRKLQNGEAANLNSERL